MKAIKSLEKLSKPFWIAAGIIALCGVGILDYITGYELSFSLFYLLPIVLVSWFTNYKLGIATAFVSAGVWITVDVLSGVSYSHPVIYFWNTSIRLGFFLITVFSLELGKKLEREKALSRTDYVTNAINGRFFHALVEKEIDRSVRYRYPLTIAYMDIDNFKTINDRFGHTTGDKVLGAVAKNIQQSLRKTDIVARLGGDEFAILLPDVGSDAAQVIISKVHSRLLKKMQENKWSVTFSIGVLTFIEAPQSVDEAIKIADKAMYSVKK
jgi:diguanylate cyclase (GGDEF)-like protein